MLGNWRLKDEGDRSCLVELYLEPRGTTQRRWAQGLVACSNGMSNIDSWLLVEVKISLFDPAGKQIGIFESVTERKYAGVFTLTTEFANRATMERF
ncbi:MAG: AprI/Inh family metalloprotease inhibitor [Fimbriimonadaceae bacterium]|nr:AprI/Inh family metalloprotease inhibitor [Alphaproteobacteria bacterium]